MQLPKKSLLIPLLITGATIGTGAQPTSTAGQGVRMPESYQSFFPSAPEARGPKTMEQTVELLNGIKSHKFIPKPQLVGAPLQAAAKASSSDANIYGFLYYFQGNDLKQGLYRINSTSKATYLWTDEYTESTMVMNAGWLRDGKLCGLNTMKWMGSLFAYGQIELNFATGELLDFHQLRYDGENLYNQYLTIAYRDFDGRVYGYGYDADGKGYAFNSAEADDIDTSEMLIDVTYDEVCTSLCYNLQDDLFYGVNTKCQFVSVDTEGTQEVIFDLGIADYRATVTGIVYSPKDDKYIWNLYKKDGSAAMYAIDAEAKTATKLYDCPAGEEYIYMVCSDVNAAPTAPAMPTLNSYTFTGANLNGTASYTLPASSVDNTTLTGQQLDWRFYVDGNEVLNGTANAGTRVNVDIDDVYNGMHTFAFSAGKDGKYSIPVTFSCWVGPDCPVAPEKLELTETKLTWEPVTEGTHGGYIDASAVNYVVYLNETKVGETTSTEMPITLPQGQPFTSYTAQVMATYSGKQSELGTSNYITYGDPLEINPKIYFRPEEKEFELFKAIDLDGGMTSDGQIRNWQFSTYMGFPSFMSGAAGEDLLIFPPMNFTKTDKSYQFSMEAGLRHDMDVTGTIEVWIGKEPTMEGMTQRIMAPYAPQYMRGDLLSEYFAVSEPGTYYIGILTKTNQVGIHISELTVNETDRPADVPLSVEDLKATPADNGALSATVDFTLPTMTANGKLIPDNTVITANVVSRSFVLNHPDQGDVTETKTVSGTPGQKLSVEVKTIQNKNTIGVSCTIDGRTGTETTTEVYTGVVKPYIVQNLKATISEDNLSARLTWTPPVESDEVDGSGPIGDTFYYSIWFYSDGWQHLDDAGWDVLEAEVALDEGAPQNYYMLGIMALNAAGQSTHISSLTVVIGTPYTLPMVENLPNYEETYWPIMIQRPNNRYQGTYWMLDDPATVSPLFANDTDVAYIGYIGDEGLTSAMSRVSLPKFSTENVADVKVSLTYWGGPYEAKLSLLANKYGLQAPEAVGDFPKGNGWITNILSLPKNFHGEKWVELLLDSEFPNDNSFAMFSAYSISGVSGIEGIEADGEGRIFTTPGMLHVAGFAGQPLTVTDLSGRTIISVPALEDISGYAILPGVYVVKAGTTARKIAVK